MEECMANEGRWAGAAAAAAEAAAAEPDAAAAPPVQQHMHSRRRAKRPMSPVKACEIISNAWRKRLEREARLLEELKEATTRLRNEAACVVQSCFRGFLLRKALKEELQTTVIRWKNPPPGKRHEAEVSIPDPPKWTKKIPMHFCPVRQAYVCPVPVVKGRLLVRLLVDNEEFPLYPNTPMDGDQGEIPGLLLLPGSSLGDRIAPKYPWKAARQWLQQQQLQHEQQLEQQELPEKQQIQQPQQIRGAGAQEQKPQERQKQEEASTPGQDAQYFLEKGALEAPMRPPRRFGVGLLGSPEMPSSWSSTRNEQNVYSWGAPCRPPWSNGSSSSEERELSPLQKRPSWASGARLNQGRQVRVPPRWRQHQQQQQREQQDQQQEQHREQGQQRQQHQQEHSNEYGSSQHQYGEGSWATPSNSKSPNCYDAEDVGFFCTSFRSSGEGAVTGEGTTQTTTAALPSTAGLAATSISCSCEAPRGLCSPQLPTVPSYWALSRSSTGSPRGSLSSSRGGELPLTPLSSPFCQQQQRWGQPMHRCSFSPLLRKSRPQSNTPRKGAEWHALAEEEYPWTPWPWGLSKNSPAGDDSLEFSLRDSGFGEHEAERLPSCRCLDRWADATVSHSCSCNTNEGSRRSATNSSHSHGGQGPPGPLRKCREALIGTADLTGGLLWARRRSHSYWELRRPFSASHLLLRFTRSLSLQW